MWWLALALAAGVGVPGVWPPQAARADALTDGAGARLLDALLAEVDGQTIAASDVALARALGVLGLGPSPGPVTRADVERVVDARLLVEEARRIGIAAEPPALAAAWAEVAARAGGPTALDAWLDDNHVARDWARGLVEQEILRRRFIEQRFRAFVFVGEAEIDAAGPAPDGDREAVRRRLTEAQVEQGLAEWLAAARARARLHIRLAPGATVPLVLPMPGRAGRAP